MEGRKRRTRKGSEPSRVRIFADTDDDARETTKPINPQYVDVGLNDYINIIYMQMDQIVERCNKMQNTLADIQVQVDILEY